MENTKKILEVIRQELNANPIAQEALSIAAARAEELNYTAEHMITPQSITINFRNTSEYTIF